jgi:hypothetical protein
MEFEYCYETIVTATIDVDDIGNFAIEATNNLGETYYLVVLTTLGTSRIFEYGPIVLDIDLLPKSCNCSFKRTEFKDTKIKKTIENFLNNPYHKILQAKVIDYKEALNNCKSIIDEMKKEEI